MMHASLLAAAMLVSALSAPQPGSLLLTADTPWVVATDEAEPVQRALDDLARDWYKVLGHPPIILPAPPKDSTIPVVYLGANGPWLRQLAGDLPAGAESFILREAQDPQGRRCLVATGNDLRGTIYAAYALSEEVLGVDPWYFWTDMEPKYRGTIEVAPGLSRRYGPPTVRYRGWFINDEDLLHTFARDPMRENVFSLAMYDRIYETILRLRGNMVVPGTFQFPDERANVLAARRGLALNMHHIQVVGLNTYRWPSNVPYSYQDHPEILEKAWQDCVNFYAPYETVWTVGYRGKHDRPFWVDDPSLDTPDKRGALISKAIATQVGMVRKVQPHATIISNLWMEGASLYHSGYIKLPSDVVLVWPDDGAGIPRDEGHVAAGQGVYYHTAMLSGWSNQLSEMLPPGRIYAELGRFVKASATEFFLVNVSDVRPIPLTTDCAMKFVWDASRYLDKSDRENMDAFLFDWSRRYIGGREAKEAAALYNQYFDLPYHRRGVRQGDNRFHTMIRQLDRDAAPAMATGTSLPDPVVVKARQYAEDAEAALALLGPLRPRAEALESRVPADRRDFFHGHLGVQVALHLHSNEMLLGYCQTLLAYASGEKAAATTHAAAAVHAIDEFFAALRSGENGPWRGWYQGEELMAVEATRTVLARTLARLQGGPAPLARPGGGYPHLYQYQEPFSADFPFLYPEAQRQR